MDDIDTAEEVLALHLAECEEDRPWRAWHRNAYATEFWSGNCWSRGVLGTQAELADVDGADTDGLPVKIQINQIEPFISSRVANLFLRSPRVVPTAPRVLPARKRGRPRSLVGAEDAVSGYLDDWLIRSDVKEAVTYGYQMAMMYAYSAFKLGAATTQRKQGTALERVWVDALPPWEAVLDRRARSRNTEAYRGHFRFEHIEDARRIVEDDLQDIETVSMPDYLIDGMTSRSGPAIAQRLKQYVALYEHYDLIKGTQCFYVASSANPGNLGMRKVGKAAPIPYTLPSGRPGVPIEPIILSNLPEYPLYGLSAVKRVYQLNAEDNLMLTIVINAMRRDSARIILYLKERGIDQSVIDIIMSGRDLALAGIDGDTLQGLFEVLQMPALAPTLNQARQFVAQAREEASGASEFMQGKQLKYASAEEARHVATYGELSITETGDRMGEALARTAEMVLAITAAEMTDDIVVVNASGDLKLTREIASLPWSIAIADSSGTPTRDQQKKTEWAAVRPELVALIATASAAVQGTPEAEAAAAAGLPVVSAATQRFAQEAINYTVQLHQLPDSLSWDSIAAATADAGEGEADAQADSEVDGLLQRLAQAIVSQQQPQPGVTDGNQLPQV